MNRHSDNPGIRWWEYPLYVLVTGILLFIGLIMVVFSILTPKSVTRFVLLTLTVLVVVAAFAAHQYFSTVDIGEQQVAITIERGASFSEVADSLVSHGVVRYGTMLRLAARIRGIDRSLTPGRYEFVATNSCKSVLDRLEAADFLRIRITIPEGAPIWQVASIVSGATEVDSAAIVNLKTDTAFLRSVDLPYLEGYLFPETYFVAWGSSAEDIAREMVAMYRRATGSLNLNNSPLGLTKDDVLKLASIVEAEATVGSERAKIASVYLNRLKIDMKLDADPTVIYGLGGLDRELYRSDLRRDTPYNTYLHKGLPPTPINSPGRVAIEAVLNPEETEFLFFVADGTGGHIFSRTNAEHNRARRSIRNQAGSR